MVVSGGGASECFGFVLGWFVKLYRLVIFVLRLKQLRNLITVEKGERMLFTKVWLNVEMHVNSEIRGNV